MSSGENGRLAGRYRIVRRLGRGGMGVVWQAVDEVLGREVAVKELRTYTDTAAPELDAMRLRMQREARAAARVRHPGVVAVHDVTEHEGRPVIVMELVDGPSLDDVLAAQGPLDPVEAARIGARVLEALAAAHEAGVLHRDVKPGNILLDRSGRVLLTDFGIATIEDPGDGSAARLTRSGEIVGSLDYLSPERARGAAPGPAADVWALGATLYAAVEGAVPFRRTSTWSTLAAIVTDPLPDPVRSGVLTPVLLRLLCKDPEGRPSAREAAGMLAEVVAGAEGAAGAAVEAGGEGVAAAAAAGTPVAESVSVPGSVPVPVPVPPPVAEPVAASGSAAADAPGAEALPAPVPVPMSVSAPVPAAVPVPMGSFGPPAPPLGEAAAPPGRGGAGGRARERRRRRGVVAAAVAGVVLVGGGITYGAIDRTSGGAAAAGDQPAQGATGEPGRVLDGRADVPRSSGSATGPATRSPGPGESATPSGGGSATGDVPPGKSAGASPGATGAAPAPSKGGGGGGAAATAGAGPTIAAPATTTPPVASGCTASGSSATCQVVRTATSTRYDGGEMGTVGAGPQEFFCQVDLDHSETYGGRSSRWWARTDDDSGNTNVYVSVLHLKGGSGGGPVEGLRIC
ncbi:serine/threonine-protein kinase [Streptomyces sp. NBC_01268]|uniref:serine/threonine-protein kinase n=1 Tax=Streptomyces sp. NBC_01268 TaxID=2903806 RepID=UPI002E3764A9|nr:protein kinase [Streptomyces sp. NBC_01268]